MDILFTFILTFIIVYVLLYLRVCMEIKRINNYLYKDYSVEKFLSSIDNLLKKRGISNKFKNFLNINKVAGLIYADFLDESLDVLKNSIDPEELNPVMKAVYYNDLIYVYLLTGKKEAANSTYISNKEILVREYKNNSKNHAFKNTIAFLHYCNEDYKQSRNILEELLTYKLNIINKIETMQYLGNIYIKEGLVDKGKKMLLDAFEINKFPLFEKTIKESLKELDDEQGKNMTSI
jgi:tetratricopeptide (TPR) repeat protein